MLKYHWCDDNRAIHGPEVPSTSQRSAGDRSISSFPPRALHLAFAILIREGGFWSTAYQTSHMPAVLEASPHCSHDLHWRELEICMQETQMTKSAVEHNMSVMLKQRQAIRKA
jgi:hypothetical protein